MVAAADAVEAGLLGLDRLAQELIGRELLVRAEVEVADRGPPLVSESPTPANRRITDGLGNVGTG